MGGDAIEYSMSDEHPGHGMNEALYVKSDDQTMYFEPRNAGVRAREREAHFSGCRRSLLGDFYPTAAASIIGAVGCAYTLDPGKVQ